MEQRDYLKKQIDQLGKVLAQLLNLLNTPAALEEISNDIEKVEQLLANEGVNLSEINMLSPTELIEQLTIKKNIGFQNLELLAEILFTKGKTIKNRICLEQSLAIYEYLKIHSTTYNFAWGTALDQIKLLLKPSI